MSKVSNLISQISVLKKKRGIYKKRQAELQIILPLISGTVSGHSEKVNRHMNRCAQNIEQGVKVTNNQPKAPESLKKSLDKTSDMSGVISNVSNELKRCSNKIDDYDEKIIKLSMELDEAIEEEKKDRL